MIFALTVFLALSAQGQAEASRSVDSEWALRTLRSEWHDTGANSEKAQKLQSKYGLVDIAENQLVLLTEGSSVPRAFFNPTKDFPLSQLQLSVGLGTDPFDIPFLTSLASRFFINWGQRPWDAFIFFLENPAPLFFPLFLAFLVVITFHIFIWARAIGNDLPRSLRSESPFPIIVALLSSVIMSLVLRQWIAFAVFWGFWGLAYSRQKLAAMMSAVFLAFALGAWAQFPVWSPLFRGTEIVEALQEGRTRIEYAQNHLNEVPPFEQALWAYQNQDFAMARRWLDETPSSPSQQAFKIILNSDVSEPQVQLKRLSELPFADTDPLTLYNRSQLAVRSQQLLLADELRAKIHPQTQKLLSHRSSRQDQYLLAPDPISPLELISWRSQQIFSSWINQSGFSPWSSQKAFLTLLNVGLPLLLFLFFIFWSRRCSGLCRQTGSPTLTSAIETSSHVQAMNQRNDAAASSSRVQLEMETRGYQMIKTRAIRHWSWLYPFLGDAFEGEGFWLSWLKTSLLVGLLWMSFSPEGQMRWLKLFSFGGDAQFVHSYSCPLFGALFLVVYSLLLVRAWRESTL